MVPEAPLKLSTTDLRTWASKAYSYHGPTKPTDMLTYEELTPEIMEEHTVIVNCTPVGMYPKVDFCPEYTLRATDSKPFALRFVI